MIAPESFELDDVDGHAHAIVEDVPHERRESVVEAVKSCPEQAITVMSEAYSQSAPHPAGRRQGQ